LNTFANCHHAQRCGTDEKVTCWGVSFAYALPAGDDAVPEHEVDGAVRQRRRLGDEALKKKISKYRHQRSKLKTARERVDQLAIRGRR